MAEELTMVEDSDICATQVQTPFRTTIDVYAALHRSPIHVTDIAISSLVCLFIAGSYIPQLIQIATNDRIANAGISGWYLILLTASATTHLAARIENSYSYLPYRCIRLGELKGAKAFSALLVFFQPLVQWVAAITLLAVYVAFRTRDSSYGTGAGNEKSAATPDSSADENDYPVPSPSSAAILAIVLTHAAILLPSALYLLEQLVFEENIDLVAIAFLDQIYGLFLLVTGLLTSLIAPIPQIYLMVARSRSNLDQGSLSVLGLGLQVIAFLALAVSQGLRMKGLSDAEDAGNIRLQWLMFFFSSGLGAGWIALGFSQLLVVAVALGLGVGSGHIYL